MTGFDLHVPMDLRRPSLVFFVLTTCTISIVCVYGASQLFLISPDLTDKRCLAADVDYVDEGLNSGLLSCAASCLMRDTCYSVFYNTMTGTCTGCTSVYIYSYANNPAILQDESGTIHVTLKIDCGQPEPITGMAVFVSSTTFTSTAMYACSTYGYTELQGDASTTCQLDSTWTSVSALCGPVDCGAPPSDLVLLDFTGDTHYPAQFPIRCYHCTSYPQNGSTISCQGNGQWSSHIPCIHGTELGVLADGNPIPPGATGCVSSLGVKCSDTDFVSIGTTLYGQTMPCYCDVICCDFDDCCYDADCRP